MSKRKKVKENKIIMHNKMKSQDKKNNKLNFIFLQKKRRNELRDQSNRTGNGLEVIEYNGGI